MNQTLRSALTLLLISLLPAGAHAAPSQLSWPPMTAQCRPWAYWWWMGSAVDKANLSRELQRYHDAGLGGVHIIPIYGAVGFEDKYLTYLSPEWMEMLGHTVSEAARLGMGVDMTTGSGWCFGGPNVREQEANALVQVKTFEAAPGTTITQKFDRASIQALMAFPAAGKAVDLLQHLSPEGTVDWTAATPARIYAISQRFSGQKVKRPAPGGEGPMLNLIYPQGVSHFLERYTAAFAGYTGPKPRAMYHDSYEYRSDWGPDFFAQFEKRRGYRLQDELQALFGKEPSDHAARVKCDYRETVSDIMAEESLPHWAEWSHGHGFITRNEAHGSPGNLLDLYAAADIPETEMFNKDRDKLVSKFASSAAHVAGRALVGCETGTWLKEHFTETLADLKYLADDVFLSGVNHVFYHGTCYSPDEAGWPGWLFYASTEMNPRNSIWHDVPALNAYVARCQSILQDGSPDNDVLLYWPIHDFWQSSPGMLPHLTVHARNWLSQQAVGKAAERLWTRGYSFDYVSDRQLATTRFTNGMLETAGARYRAIVVPRCEHMPVATLRALAALAEAGATIIFEDRLPQDVPGWGSLEQRRAELRNLIRPEFVDSLHGCIVKPSIEEALVAAGISREALVDQPGLWFIRRRVTGGCNYFIANRGEIPLDGWIPLATAFKSAALLDPMTGRSGMAHIAPENKRVRVQLAPGGSIVVRTFENDATGPGWEYVTLSGMPAEIGGNWQVTFVSGGPALPKTTKVAKLRSWADSEDVEAQRFAGTARYTIHFDVNANIGSEALLDLGRVCQSARVRVNGGEWQALIIPPFRTRVSGLKPEDNLLEVEVTNVSANRIRDLDRRGVKWKSFHDINFVNMDYKPFNAAQWPLADSGLLGPVTVQRIQNPDSKSQKNS